MSTTQSPAPDALDAFEERLLVSLRREVEQHGTDGPSSRRPAPRPARRVLAAAAGVAAATVVGVVLVPGLGSTAAYSVEEGNAGEIEVEINRPEDAAGLEQALEEHGIEADVTYLPALQTCAPGRYDVVERDVRMSFSLGQDRVSVTLPPGAVRDGETFVMVWSVEAVPAPPGGADENGVTTLDGTAASVMGEVSAGPVGPCEVVPTAG